MTAATKPAAWRNRIVGSAEVPPAELVPNDRNWRLHPKAQVDALEGALGEVGWVQQVIVNRTTGRLVDGHARAASALKRNEPFVPVLYVELTEAEEALVLASLDPIGALAERDQTALDTLIASTSVSDEALRRMLEDLASPDLSGLTDPDDAGPVPVTPWVKTGDLFELGGHRVLCGDATDPEAYALVGGGIMGDAVWTDPPYGVSYVGKTRDRLTIAGDDSDVGTLIRDACLAATGSLRPSAAFYVAAPAGPRQLDFRAALAAAGWRLHQELVWLKDRIILGHSDYHYQHEPILYGYLPGEGRPGRGKHAGSGWMGDHSQTSVIEVASPKRSTEHPTMKPVELIARTLVNSVPKRGIVLDPFLGSGSTLVAAEGMGLRCFGLDVDPRFVQVVVERWQAFTGKEAVRVSA